MATHSSMLAWTIPWTEEPGGLQSIGPQSRTRVSNLTHTHHSCRWTENELAGERTDQGKQVKQLLEPPGGGLRLGGERGGQPTSSFSVTMAMSPRNEFTRYLMDSSLGKSAR